MCLSLFYFRISPFSEIEWNPVINQKPSAPLFQNLFHYSLGFGWLKYITVGMKLRLEDVESIESGRECRCRKFRRFTSCQCWEYEFVSRVLWIKKLSSICCFSPSTTKKNNRPLRGSTCIRRRISQCVRVRCYWQFMMDCSPKTMVNQLAESLDFGILRFLIFGQSQKPSWVCNHWIFAFWAFWGSPYRSGPAAWAPRLGPHMQGMPQAAGAPHLADDKDLEMDKFQSTKRSIQYGSFHQWGYPIVDGLYWISLLNYLWMPPF